MLKTSCFLLIFLVIVPFVSADIIITEIMYDPGQCKDSNCEWVEIYNQDNETVDLSNCTFENKKFGNETIGPKDYLVISRNSELFKQFFNEESVEKKFSLTNSGDIVTLGGECNDVFSYKSLVELANGNNKTLARRFDGSWGESLTIDGTPGKQNIIWEFSDDFSQIEITEILPNPFDKDDEQKPYGEWVEIHNKGNEPIDVGGLYLSDKIKENELFIAQNKILNEATVVYPDKYLVVFRDGDSDFALNNNGYDEVILWDEEKVIDYVSFTGSTEGMSWSKINNNWYLTPVTPGEENNLLEGCDWELNIKTENSIFHGNDLELNIESLRNYGPPGEITVRGQIEDVFGKVVKKYSPWTNHSVTSSVSKTYSPNLKEGTYQVSFWYENLHCSDVDENNRVTYLLAINPTYQLTNSKISIERLYLGNDNEVEWGDQFRVKVKLYKGDETKKAVYLWVESNGKTVSKRTQFSIDDPFKEYILTLPIQLEPNCNLKLEENNAVVVLEAFGIREEVEISIDGVDESICKDYLDYVDDNEEKVREVFEIVNLPSKIYAEENVPLEVKITSDKNKHNYKVWSYIYRGSKCYSCNEENDQRDKNLQEVNLAPLDTKNINFNLGLDPVEQGEYKIKIKVNKDGQKTNREFTKTINVVTKEEVKNTSQELSVQNVDESEQKNNPEESRKRIIHESSGIVVYRSSSAKAEKLIPYLLLLSIFFIIGILLNSEKEKKKKKN
ncbi:lamin tail domain-containing protein [Candidatus Woesearchaeota archaeon]|nr:lamin tail domain-containing protein [Candidatus Woesearchaeota archaeon]